MTDVPAPLSAALADCPSTEGQLGAAGMESRAEARARPRYMTLGP